eukprot:scpid104457/ scgid26994/ 
MSPRESRTAVSKINYGDLSEADVLSITTSAARSLHRRQLPNCCIPVLSLAVLGVCVEVIAQQSVSKIAKPTVLGQREPSWSALSLRAEAGVAEKRVEVMDMAKRTWRCDFKSHLVLASSENNQEQLSKLTESLLDWINDTVRKRSIVVRSFFADLWDGSVLVELLEILRGVQLGIGPNIHISVSGSAVRE